MAVKFTMLFQLATNITDPTLPARRLAGWSESWYQLGTDGAAALALAVDGTFTTSPLLAVRAALLPVGAAIVGQRIQVVDPRGTSQTAALQYPGASGVFADIPQMALLLNAPGVGVNNIRRVTLRGIPDARVVEGEYTESAAYRAARLDFVQTLGVWRFRGRDLSLPQTRIFTISVAGLVTTETPHLLAVNDIVRIARTMDAASVFQGGRFIVATVGPGTNAFTVTGWTHGATTGGTVRKDAIVYPLVDSALTAVNRIVTRRVGRPFAGYRGRRSTQR